MKLKETKFFCNFEDKVIEEKPETNIKSMEFTDNRAALMLITKNIDIQNTFKTKKHVENFKGFIGTQTFTRSKYSIDYLKQIIEFAESQEQECVILSMMVKDIDERKKNCLLRAEFPDIETEIVLAPRADLD